MDLEREQKRLEVEIKKLAREGQMQAVRVAAKDLGSFPALLPRRLLEH